MANTTVYEDDAAIRRIVDELARPPLVLWRSRLLVHDRNETGEACPCCGSTTAVLTETIDDYEIMIDRQSGERLHRNEVDAETWAALAESAEVADMAPIVFRSQLEIVRSEARLTVVDGGAQSGKTEGAARLFARLLGLRGGYQKTFWLIAPSRRSAWIQAQKLAVGYRGRPPVLPACLVRDHPTTGQGSHPLLITLIDGSVIDCRPAVKADGSSVDGEECEAVWVDEVTKIRYRIYWEEAMNRTTATGGPVIGTSVPMPGHWFKEEIDAAEKGAEAGGASILHVAVSRYDNYSISRELVDEQVRIMKLKPNGQVLVDLHVLGKWVNPDGRPFWTSFDKGRHVLQRPLRDISRMIDPRTGRRFHDVTRLALGLAARGGGWFISSQTRTNDRWILGQDVNLSPCSAVVGQVAGDPDNPTDVDKWTLVVLDEVSREYSELGEFAATLGEVHRGDYKGCTIFVDGTSMTRSSKAVKGGKGNASGRALARAGFDARPPATYAAKRGRPVSPRNPDHDDSHALIHRLLLEDRLLVGSNCPRLLEAFERQEEDRKGKCRPHKDPNTASDRLSNAMDGLRYLAWPIFGEATPKDAARPAVGIASIPVEY